MTDDPECHAEELRTVTMIESPGNPRIGDADRDLAARHLRAAVAHGELDLVELDRRLVSVYAARTSGELIAATGDLAVTAARIEPLRVRVEDGTRTQTGEWVVPARITAECASGSVVFDFTRALCPHREVEVAVSVGSGDLTLIVPRGWHVDLDRVEISSGSVRSRVVEPRLTGMPSLRVRGQVGSGVVTARYPDPPRRRSLFGWLSRKSR